MRKPTTANPLKTVIAALAIILGMLAVTSSIQAQGETKFVVGKEFGIPPCKVIQTLDEGLLLYAERIDEKPGFSDVYAQEAVVIVLTGYPDAVVDDECTTYCTAKYVGTFKYTTTEGTTKTVRKFAFVRKGNK